MRRLGEICLALLCSGLLVACQTGPLTGEDPRTAASTEVRKSPNDSRDYRYLELPNELRVLLVSDPETDLAAASLVVFRGSMHEPDDRVGIAHFLEHMLFVQTEAYPKPGEFQTFVAANGGMSNAYTALDHTNYFFSVKPDAFPEALDRWGNFFVTPLLSAEYSEREKNAVHSEYQMQMKDDGWRGYMVGKQAMNPAHPASRFTVGSLETLAGDIQADLVQFFETQYSADQMALVVLTDMDLDALEDMVSQLFSQVENKNLGPSYVDIDPYLEGQRPLLVERELVKQGATLEYAFTLPSVLPHYRSKPQQYLANLLGHEGPEGLAYYLQQAGWVSSLGVGVSDLDRNTSTLSISMDLTAAGEQRREEIGAAIFAYLDMLRAQPPAAWLYEEQATVARLGFRFQEKSDPVGFVYQMAPLMDKYPAEDLLVARYLMEDFNPKLIGDYLDQLVPANLVVTYAASELETDAVEPWFNVPYRIETNTKLPAAADLAFGLPATNPYLPDNLELVAADELPMQKISAMGIDIWLDTDTSFNVPRASTRVNLAAPGGITALRDRAMAQLYRRLVADRLNSETYPAYLAGLSFSLGVGSSGFGVAVSGYADKQLPLLERILKELHEHEIDADRFTVQKAELIEDWLNTQQDRPFRQTMARLDSQLRADSWPATELAAALEEVQVADLYAFRQRALAEVGVLAMLHGSVTTEDAEALAGSIRSAVTVADIERFRPSVRDLVQAEVDELAVDHNDAALVLYVQDEDESWASRARSSLAVTILQPQYFHELRTEQQLGYIVGMTNQTIAQRGGVTFIVQSPSAPVAQIEAATIEFMDQQIEAFANTTEAELAEHKAGLINRLLESPKNLSERSSRYWADLNNAYWTLDSREQIAAEVEKLTVADIQAMYQRIRNKLTDNSGRLSILTQGKFGSGPAAAG